jgi:hypothetical protein
MTKLNENEKRTVYIRESGIVVRKKKQKKSAPEQWDDRMNKKAKAFDKKVLGI